MKKLAKIWISPFALMAVMLILSYGCNKEDDVITVTDVDGNVYTTVKIGSQVWMAENLKTTRYRNGDSIKNVTDSLQWINLVTGAYCRNITIGNDPAAYGYLYNWYAATDTRNIAPAGWHIPSQSEWAALVSYLGGEEVAGGKVKESGTTHWKSPNTGATNESGFNALPAGVRDEFGSFFQIGYEAIWWSATNHSGTIEAWCAATINISSRLASDGVAFKNEGLSIRCIKD
jgi:uncharacterized protein (TIGR02145 family)